MKLVSRFLLVLCIVLMAAPAAFAAKVDDEEQKQLVQRATASNPASNAGIGMGLAAVGAGIGLGLVGFSALSGLARQPEQAGKIQGLMYVVAALVEGTAIIAMVLCFLVAARLIG